MKTELKIILSIIVLIFFIDCDAQQVGVGISSSTVSIYNSANAKTSILLGDTTLKLDTFILKPNEVWQSPAYLKDPVIKIRSQNHVVTYLLKRGNSFMIYWNRKRKYWDVKKIRSRQS